MVGIEATDIEAAGTHGPGVHQGVLYHVVGEVAGGVLATAIGYTLLDEIDVFLQIDIERGNGPVALGLPGLLFHVQYAQGIVDHNNAGALELLDGGLLVAHDAGGVLLQGEVDELLEGEEQEVVGSNYEHVVVDVQLVDGKEEVAHGSQTGVVGLGAIVDNGDGLGVGLTGRPFLEDGGKLVVGDDDVLIDLGDAVDIIEHTAQYGTLAYLQQGLGEVLGEFAQAGGVAGGNNYIFQFMNMIPTPSPSSRVLPL